MTTALVVILSASATGCGDSTKPVTLPVTSISTTPPSQDLANAAVLAAYTGLWSDYQRDLLTANWQNPASANHATGQALASIKEALSNDSRHGWIGKGAPVPHPTVKSLALSPSASAEVVDCIDLSHALLYVATTGALKDSTPGGRHLVDAGLVMQDGVWKVSTMTAGQVGSC